MQTHIALRFQDDPDVAEADTILRSCVHCGFCIATCPTYQILGDELDGPRGRIYLIKEFFAGAPATEQCCVKVARAAATWSVAACRADW